MGLLCILRNVATIVVRITQCIYYGLRIYFSLTD